jgi:hypothetical protein
VASIPGTDLDDIEAQAKRNLSMATALGNPEVVFLSGVILRLTAEVRAAHEVVREARLVAAPTPWMLTALREYDQRG